MENDNEAPAKENQKDSQISDEEPPPPPAREERPTIDSGRIQHTSQREQKHPLEWAIAIMLFFTLAATSAAAYYTRQQWLTAGDTEKRSLRAYVGAGNVAVTENPPQITIDVENYGQTPATDAKVFNSWHDVPTGQNLPDDFSFPDKEECPDALKSSVILYPHVALHSVAETPKCAAVLATIARSVAGQSVLYLYGRIEYLDVFLEPHTSTFCLTWASGTSSYCDRHNEIDPPKERR